jgi:DNA primase
MVSTVPNVELLKGFPGAKRNGEWLLIRCPFHNDHNPSLSVRMTPPAQGVFKCFSCGAKGGFKKLAEKLGLDLNAAATPDLFPDEYAGMFQAVSDQDDEVVTTTYPLNARNAEKLGITKGWRGFDLDFLRDVVRARVINRYMLYFPVLMNGEEVGYVQARVAKQEGYPSYLNKKGTWSKDKGLLLFDQALAIAKEHAGGHGSSLTVILTEGPRDPMRLIRDAHLPAIAILGTQSWSEAKLRKLVLAGVENLILCMDGDDAGRQASEMITESSDGYVNIHDFKLYEWEGEYDPGNMPVKLVNRLKKLYTAVSRVQHETP